jgi:hypothetical protein
MRHIEIGRLEAASVDSNPFDHVIVQSFLRPETVDAVNDTFPNILSGGSHILKDYGAGAAISDVIAELDSRARPDASAYCATAQVLRIT